MRWISTCNAMWKTVRAANKCLPYAIPSCISRYVDLFTVAQLKYSHAMEVQWDCDDYGKKIDPEKCKEAKKAEKEARAAIREAYRVGAKCKRLLSEGG